MTAPVYKDKDVVEGMPKTTITKIASDGIIEAKMLTREQACHNSMARLARVALACWEERDKARETAALQDAGIHAAQGRLWALTKLWAAIKTFQERGYESGFKEMNEAIASMQRFEAGEKTGP